MVAFSVCVDEEYMLPGLVVICSLAEALRPAARRESAIRVLSSDLSRGHASTMADLARRVGFGSFDFARCVPSRGSALVDDSYITLTTYLRFSLTAQFVEHPHVIYLDADTLVLDDVTLPLDQVGRGRIGAVADEFNRAIGTNRALPGLTRRVPEVRGRTYYNAGALWIPSGMLTRVREGVEWALAHGRRHIFHNDQDALNLWLLAYDGVCHVDARFNRFELGRFTERGDWAHRVTQRGTWCTDTALLHFVGGQKPWQASCPSTEGVRLYRSYLRDTVRQVHRLGDLSVRSGLRR